MNEVFFAVISLQNYLKCIFTFFVSNMAIFINEVVIFCLWEKAWKSSKRIWQLRFLYYCSIKFKTALSPCHIISPTNDDLWEIIPQDFPDHTYWHLQAVLSMLFPVGLYMLHVNINAIYVYNVQHVCYLSNAMFAYMHFINSWFRDPFLLLK